jgi:hypothetical protein
MKFYDYPLFALVLAGVCGPAARLTLIITINIDRISP